MGKRGEARERERGVEEIRPNDQSAARFLKGERKSSFSRKIAQILMEQNYSKNSLEYKLQILYICSVKTLFSFKEI